MFDGGIIQNVRRSCTGFVDLEKAYDGVPKEEVVLHEEASSGCEVCEGGAEHV